MAELNRTDELLEEIAFLADRLRKYCAPTTAQNQIHAKTLMKTVCELRAWESEMFLKEEAELLELYLQQREAQR